MAGWRADIQRHREEREALTAKLKANEQELKAIEKALAEKTREFRIFEERKKTLDEVKAELSLIETKRKEGVEREQRAATLMRMGVIASLLLAISLIGLIVQPVAAVFILLLRFSSSRDHRPLGAAAPAGAGEGGGGRGVREGSRLLLQN